jgi:flagellar protein FliL
MANQFIVPVMKKGKVAAMVILSLSLEVKPGMTSKVYDMEPKLRDVFLQVMFDHANAGGFDGSYTDGCQPDPVAQSAVGGRKGCDERGSE